MIYPQATSYAIEALAFVAGLDAGATVKTRQLSEILEIPEQYLGKVMTELVQKSRGKLTPETTAAILRDRQAPGVANPGYGNQAAINSNLTTDFRGLGTDTHQYTTTFSPLGELRVNVAFQATSNVALKVGYTGIVVGNVSRASNRIDYDSVNLIGILPTNFHQTFFANGINFGVEINR